MEWFGCPAVILGLATALDGGKRERRVSRRRQSTLGVLGDERPGAIRDLGRHLPAGRHARDGAKFREEKMMEASEQPQDLTSRRSFLLKGAAVGAASLGAGGLLSPKFGS